MNAAQKFCIVGFAVVLVFDVFAVYDLSGRPSAVEVIAAAEDAGFTHDQAVFLRHGPLSSVTVCKSVGLTEMVCNFLSDGVGERHSDEMYYAACHVSGLQRRQCILLREGVAEYHKSFSKS